MSEPLFNIVTFGMIQPGADRNEVATKMAALFKTTPDKLKPYFAGGRKVIKSNVDELVAEKYRVTLEKVGLVVKVEEAEDAPPPAKKVTASTGGVTLADVGADILKESERAVVEAQPIGDITDIDIAAIGADVLSESERAVVEPQAIADISDVSMSDVGADVIENPEPKPVSNIDTGDVSMAEVGANVIENPEPKPVADIDTGDISMAEVGANVIENPKPKEKVDIDTSDIELV